MKVLTIRQPYASAIMSGVKTYVTRTWHPGRVDQFAIYAALELDQLAQDTLLCERLFWPTQLPGNVILGIVKVVDVTYAEELFDEVSPLEKAIGRFEDYYLAWKLEVVLNFGQPFLAPAHEERKFFWDWSPPPTKEQMQHVKDYLNFFRNSAFPNARTFED